MGIIILFCQILYCQDLPIDDIVLGQCFKTEVINKEEILYSDFDKLIFDSVTDSITAFSTCVENNNYLTIDKYHITGFIIKYENHAFLKALQNLNTVYIKGYKIFSDSNDEDYKDYNSFIKEGLILVSVPQYNIYIGLYANTCIFNDNKSAVTSLVKKNSLFSDTYIFNCGGKKLIEKIK